ncbi:Bgt-50597 [Blumeria graminis f. sp. tritici]|uniref:Bgt-50597 n=1 Tax=Blumeria graminis f. sp. tritici TaxID=62690 RepID=A0A9X9LAD9_BLUGR|nr:Bgt-50597 [Blumeria graminis f. sp. tritici]
MYIDLAVVTSSPPLIANLSSFPQAAYLPFSHLAIYYLQIHIYFKNNYSVLQEYTLKPSVWLATKMKACFISCRILLHPNTL